MGVQIPRRRGLGELEIANGQNQYIIGTSEAAADTGGTTVGNNPGTNANDVAKLPGSGDPKAPISSGTTAKASETNWLGWGLVAAGVGGLILVGMAARKRRRRA